MGLGDETREARAKAGKRGKPDCAGLIRFDDYLTISSAGITMPIHQSALVRHLGWPLVNVAP